MLDMILKGGIINIILLCAYFFVVIISLERFIYFFVIRGSYKLFKKDLLDKLKEKKHKKSFHVEEYFKEFQKSPYLEITKTYISNIHKPYNEHNELIQKTGNLITKKMEAFLWTLNLTGHIAPLLGLLGTMTGLIRSFKAIAEVGGHADISVLSGGIWEAMMTTVMGLIVAIIAFSIHKILDNHIDKKNFSYDRSCF
ncbi:MotA/TolQ/ExbB proton channel family protein [bacterium]